MTFYPLGWRRDLPDHRDFLYAAPADVLQTLPPSVDLRPGMPAPYDQGRIGSCTGNAIAAAIQFARKKLNEAPDFTPSRLFVYWNERNMERSIPMDAGAEIRDGIKSVATLGVPPESAWPYIATPADPTTNLFPAGSPPVTKPSAQSYLEASVHTAISYARVQQTLSQLKGCLAQGYPFVFGFTVYDNFYDATGQPVSHMAMPAAHNRTLGGHAVVAAGFDDASGMFTIRNSWGPHVQDHGYFYMPYSFITDYSLANDFWTIRKLST